MQLEGGAGRKNKGRRVLHLFLWSCKSDLCVGRRPTGRSCQSGHFRAFWKQRHESRETGMEEGKETRVTREVWNKLQGASPYTCFRGYFSQAWMEMLKNVEYFHIIFIRTNIWSRTRCKHNKDIFLRGKWRSRSQTGAYQMSSQHVHLFGRSPNECKPTSTLLLDLFWNPATPVAYSCP